MGAFRGAPHPQARPAPHRTGPRHRDQYQTPAPPQPPGFDTMRLSSTHRSAVAAFRIAVLAAPSLARVIQATDHLPCWGKACAQQPQHDRARSQERPTCTMQDPGIVDQTLLLAPPPATQARRHGACASREHRAAQQDCGVCPHRRGEQRCKRDNQGQ